MLILRNGRDVKGVLFKKKHKNGTTETLSLYNRSDWHIWYRFLTMKTENESIIIEGK